jgi:uncharacterized protein (UPF0216 family)
MITDVAKCMHELGMSPSELADELGLPRGQVSRLIVGEEEPDRLIGWALAGLRAAHMRATDSKSAVKTAKQTPTNPLAEELADDTWTGKTARLALPILIEIAKKSRQETITYTQLHEMVVARGGEADIGKMTKYAFPLGRIATAMTRLELPPLTSIVVSASTGLPSSGIDQFIIDHLDLNRKNAKALASDEDARRKLVKQLWDDVFAYPKWPAVMAHLGITGNPAYDR